MSIILVWVVQRAPLALNYVQGFNELSRLVGGAFAGVLGRWGCIWPGSPNIA